MRVGEPSFAKKPASEARALAKRAQSQQGARKANKARAKPIENGG